MNVILMVAAVTGKVIKNQTPECCILQAKPMRIFSQGTNQLTLSKAFIQINKASINKALYKQEKPFMKSKVQDK